jgi:uncharacterized protein (DUF1800 family)
MTIYSAIAMNRFGLGARPDQLVTGNPQKWLLNQFGRYNPRPASIASEADRTVIAAALTEYSQIAKQARQEREKSKDETAGANMKDAERKDVRKEIRDMYMAAANARLASAVSTTTDFPERLVHFWSNHFAVSVQKLPVLALAGDYEFSAIRPNIMGKFSALLTAATQHPAMLIFLDQAQSIGPGSPLAQNIAQRRNKEFGLNENLAREILELHTLGVRTGYSQSDVTELARALTGRTVAGIGGGPFQRVLRDKAEPGQSVFLDAIHQPGKRQIMGKTYSQSGPDQAAAILADLAVHPSTAKHLAKKLAVHFVSDNPPPSLIAKLEANFLKTGGDLPSLYRTLIEAPEAWPARWDASVAKFKSPWEWVVSSMRALNVQDIPGNGKAAPLFEMLGQPIWKPGSPAGFADTNETWAGGAALMRRIELAERLSRRSASSVDARQLAPKILPGILAQPTIEGIARSESPMQGLSLLLVSPEFLRR